MTTEELRASFLVQGLFRPGAMTLRFIDLDRVALGGVVPTAEPLALEATPEIAADFFTERREVGVLNIGGSGRIRVDAEAYAMENRDCLYIGRGSHEVLFESDEEERPARYYLVSYPAHAEYPTAYVRREDAEVLDLGTQVHANRRRLYKFIHPDGIRSSQLVMGLTELLEGSVWNTMPAHTHQRRTEVYLYFGLPDDAVVFHLLGEPRQTRNLVVRSDEVALSPAWSIHSGCGTASYSFCWAMGGENQAFADMQGVPMRELR